MKPGRLGQRAELAWGIAMTARMALGDTNGDADVLVGNFGFEAFKIPAGMTLGRAEWVETEKKPEGK